MFNGFSARKLNKRWDQQERKRRSSEKRARCEQERKQVSQGKVRDKVIQWQEKNLTSEMSKSI